MAWYALVTDESDIAVDLYRSRVEAENDLRDAVADEPDWIDSLSVVQVDLPEPTLN